MIYGDALHFGSLFISEEISDFIQVNDPIYPNMEVSLDFDSIAGFTWSTLLNLPIDRRLVGNQAYWNTVSDSDLTKLNLIVDEDRFACEP